MPTPHRLTERSALQDTTPSRDSSQPMHSVQSDVQQLKKTALFFALFIALITAGFGLLYLDIAVANTQILEVSFTEIGQELILALCAGLFWASSEAGGQKGFNVLAGGFFACLLIRELDGLFDPISHSFWLWPALATSAFCVFKGFGRHPARTQTISALARFTTQPAFTMIAAGIGVLVFSRVFGMGTLWHLILQEGYQRLAKTTVEEGLELLAYCIFLAGSLQYFAGQLTAEKQARGA